MLEQASAAVNREGWQKVRFDQMATNVRDQVIPAESGIDKYIGLEHLDSMSLKIKRWDEGRELKGSKLKIKAGDIVIGKRNWYLRRVAIADFDTLCSAHSMVVRPKEDTILRDFLPHFLLSDIFFETAMRISVGSLSPTINWRDLAKQEFVIPPIEKQKKIAELLWEAENSIENSDDKTGKASKLKITLMNELLSQGIAHKNFKESKIGQIPEAWDIMNLSEITNNGISNGVFNDPKKVGSGYKLINVTNMFEGNVINIHKLSLLELDANVFAKKQVKYGDIFFTRSSLVKSGIAYTNINLSKEEDITFDGHLMKINPNIKIANPIFLSYFFRGRTGRKQFISRGKTGTMTTIGQQDIATIKIPIPPLPEQKQIASILSDADAKIDALRTHHEKLVALKASLIETLLDPGTANA